ncbi:hypothetical protein IEQ34_020960 [Dendrobium chrysotoxum]|uniref:Uncharacterized protein n=1 Tax=Dendrobium chrysotoxum TaxID=161865 RepID=A0AAV7G3J2_DENCH|nr:hypothetical protein IEQ34_020960 [Dendrobium chrysotoxum]
MHIPSKHVVMNLLAEVHWPWLARMGERSWKASTVPVGNQVSEKDEDMRLSHEGFKRAKKLSRFLLWRLSLTRMVLKAGVEQISGCFSFCCNRILEIQSSGKLCVVKPVLLEIKIIKCKFMKVNIFKRAGLRANGRVEANSSFIKSKGIKIPLYFIFFTCIIRFNRSSLTFPPLDTCQTDTMI